MFRRPLLPGLMWTLLIAVLTLMPGNYIPKAFDFLDWLSPDKVIHLLLFGIYTFLLMEGFKRQDNFLLLKRYPIFTSLFLGIVFAFFTEVMQKYAVPGRNGNVYDLMADVLGSIIGIAAWIFTRRNEKKNLRSSENYK